MDVRDLLQGLCEERRSAERELALGEWRRVRCRAGVALAHLEGGLRRPEPELWAWMRILGALARVDRAAGNRRQMRIWPPSPAPPPGPAARLAPSLGVITHDPELQARLAFLGRLAATDLPVLLEGESGTGKEVVARGIHGASLRRERPFVPVNCGAIPGELQESELFGHARGAYTGAIVEKPGLFEAAHHGTLFLDEVGEMDGRAQVKLLRVLESGELRRLGEVRLRHVQVRVLAATNTQVDEAVDAGRFRRDLLFRLSAVRMALPPLRERRGDILPLAFHFLRQAAATVPPLTPGARAALLRHPWPGNVRELKFVLERALALWRESDAVEIGCEALLLEGNGDYAGGPAARHGTQRVACPADLPELAREVPPGQTLESYLVAVERSLIAQALATAEGNRTQAARLLGGVSRTTLIGKMKRLGLFEAARDGSTPTPGSREARETPGRDRRRRPRGRRR